MNTCAVLHVSRVSDTGKLHVLYHFGASRGEIYKKIFQMLYYGSSLGEDESGKMPTNVYPVELREAIRRRFDSSSAGSRDAEFQGNPLAFLVTWEHLRAAKWPKPPKTCSLCKCGRSKPY